MRPTPRITRGYFSRIPKYSTNYPDPFNWTLLWGLLPVLGIAAITVAVVVNVAWVWVVAIVLFVVLYWRHLDHREAICGRVGHWPYKPVPEVAAWRCRRCDRPLEGENERAVSEAVLAAADEVGRARLGGQARYSDRR